MTFGARRDAVALKILRLLPLPVETETAWPGFGVLCLETTVKSLGAGTGVAGVGVGDGDVAVASRLAEETERSAGRLAAAE